MIERNGTDEQPLEETAEAQVEQEAPVEEQTPAEVEQKAPVEEQTPAEVEQEAPVEEQTPVEAGEAVAGEEPKAKGKKASSIATLPTSDEELFQKGRSWYVVHTYSGYEDKVRTNLEQRIKSMDAEDLVFRVVVPSVEEMEIRDGQRRTVPKKIFPGYVLVQMITLKEQDTKASEQEMAESNKAWMVVRNSPGVTGFVGSGTAPTPLDKSEVQAIMKQMRAEEPVVKVGFTVGQSVRVTDGPFADFVGVVDEINIEKGKVKVLVSMMGRETPVELDFLQVERL
jgi:transcriptional antiterminator NusG